MKVLSIVFCFKIRDRFAPFVSEDNILLAFRQDYV